MSTAPSEKHLEDWIEANPSRFCRHRVQFENGSVIGGEMPLIDRVLFRQLRLSSGIVDLVGIHDDNIVLIELKRDAIDEKAIIQLQRYVNEVEQLVLYLGFEFFDRSWELSVDFQSHIQGIIVGNFVKQNKVLWSVPHNIQAIAYDYDAETYSFTWLETSVNYSWYEPDEIRDLALSEFGQVMKSIMRGAIISSQGENVS